MNGNKNSSVPTPLAQVMMDYLDCPCRFFPAQKDPSAVLAAWEEARARGDREGFVPVLVTVSETLWEALRMNACDEEDEDSYQFDLAQVRQYRQKVLETPLPDFKETLESYLPFCPSYVQTWNQDPAPEVLPAEEPSHSFWGYKNFATGMIQPLLLAEIPTAKAWEVFAWLPFGGWNCCPDTPALMSVSRRWRERYGAVPAVISSDTLEYRVPHPATPENAWELAREQGVFCPDSLDTDAEVPLAKLAADLAGATVWSFWWD